MIRITWFLILLLTMSACGYKPSSFYTSKVIRDKIYVKVVTSLQDPENSVIIRDAINEALIYKLHAKIVPESAQYAKLHVELAAVNFQPIEYDNNGYVIAYKTNVTLKTTYYDREGKKRLIKTYGDYDFNIESNSVISDTKRFNAIKEASQKALDAFISRLAIEGVRL